MKHHFKISFSERAFELLCRRLSTVSFCLYNGRDLLPYSGCAILLISSLLGSVEPCRRETAFIATFCDSHFCQFFLLFERLQRDQTLVFEELLCLGLNWLHKEKGAGSLSYSSSSHKPNCFFAGSYNEPPNLNFSIIIREDTSV